MGNPFCENSSDLLVLDTRDVADKTVADGIHTIENIGQKRYDAYVRERLIYQVRPISDPIKRNNIPLFTTTPRGVKSVSQQQVSSLKNDCSLFSRLYVASQIRNGDLDEFFQHENQSYPPALSKMGSIRTGAKSDLVDCLEDLAAAHPSGNTPAVQAVIIDGTSAVNMLKPGPATKTSHDFANQHLPYIKSHLQHSNRVDIIWDRYFPDSLKTETRLKRGKGVRRRVEPATRVPGNWYEFPHLKENKEELFALLAQMVTNNPLINDPEHIP